MRLPAFAATLLVAAAGASASAASATAAATASAGTPSKKSHESAAPITIAEWRVIGPFESGSREGQVHPLAEPGGILPKTWDFARSWPSALADGGRVSWTIVAAEGAKIALDLPGVDWDARESEWGAAAAANVAVLVGRLDLAEDSLLLVDAARCGGTIGGQPFSGDPYGAGIARSVVRGRKGPNEVVLLSAGFGPKRELSFQVETIDPTGPPILVIEKDLLVPDVSTEVQAAAIPLLNLTDEWLRVRVVATAGQLSRESGAEGGHGDHGIVANVQLAPLSPLKVPLPGLRVRDESPITVSVETPRGTVTTTLSPVLRKPGDPYRVTFLSRIDGSAQEYGVRPPARGEAPGLPLLLSTHGAGVGALGQVGAYGPKDAMTIVAPTNRRPFGFDWHDWGRLDFEEVRDLALARFRPDPDRVHLSGHSMGGHGAWILGALHADDFATVAPAAGWASYDTYVPFITRRSTWLGSPEIQALVLRGLGTARVSPLLENLRHVPVQVLHGGKDDNVPPPQARMLTGLLERLGGNVTYVEAPGEGHWSDLDLGRPGSDAVDPAIMDKLWGGSSRDPFPRRLSFVTPDPDVDPTRHWLRLDAQETCASVSRIDADASDPHRVVVRTRNAAAISLLPSRELGLAPDAVVEIDGEILPRVGPSEDWIAVERDRADRWQRVKAPDPARPKANARPGGLAKALFAPWAIVLPSQGDPARCEALAAIGRLIATSFWVRANGSVPIVLDTQVGDALRAERGLLLLGGPDLNAETARVQRSLSVVATPHGARLMGRRVPGRDLACAHWQPSPDVAARRLLVLQATSAEADALLPGLQPVAAGLGLPDFAIASPLVRIAGFGGFAAAGFWAPDWTLDPASTWLASSLERQAEAPPRR